MQDFLRQGIEKRIHAMKYLSTFTEKKYDKSLAEPCDASLSRVSIRINTEKRNVSVRSDRIVLTKHVLVLFKRHRENIVFVNSQLGWM